LPSLSLLLLALPVRADVDPHHSYDKLVSANGRSVVVLNGNNSSGPVLDVFSDHLYQQYAVGMEETRDLLYDSYFGLGWSGGQGWLTASDSYSYEHGTGILAIDRSQGDLAITEYVFSPLGLAVPAFVHLLRVESKGGAQPNLHAYSLHNFHLGQDDDGDGANDEGEAIWVQNDASGAALLSEWGSSTGLGMRYVPISAPASYGCDQVWNTVGGGAELDGSCGNEIGRWEGDDKVGALQWDASLQAGAEAWFGTVQSFFSDWDSGDVTSDVQAWIAGRDAETLLQAERQAWAAWLAQGSVPDGLSEDERAVYDQQLVFLKMGQVVEEGDAYGQLPASLPLAAGEGGFAHTWNIAWVRDGAYAIRGLTEAGYLDEAGAALAFLLQDKADGYRDYVGYEYSVSVCRCYGDGSEWSDEDHNGPNVEFDNFGLLLWALGDWVAAGGDIEALSDDVDGVIFDQLATVLAQLLEADEHGLDLIIADSSIWERHWNGQQKHFTYSSAWAVRGLRAAAQLAEARQDEENAALYEDAATRVRDAMCSWLLDDEGALAGNLEELDQGWGYDDLAAVDAFNNGAIDAAGQVAAASFARWDEHLAVNSGHGYRRNDDGDSYDLQEWVMVDLRLAEARRRACDDEGGQAIEDWITQQALQNHWTIPELMDPDSGDYNGPAPMMGFGAGMYVLALHNRDDAAEDCAAGIDFDCGDEPQDSDEPGDSEAPSDSDETQPGDSEPEVEDSAAEADDTGEEDESEGCGCAAAPRGGVAGLLGLLGLGLAARRRRG